ncbi:hypothetical protein Tco_1308706, partial [Tanacetum coccineum]
MEGLNSCCILAFYKFSLTNSLETCHITKRLLLFHIKKIFANMKREGKDFSGKVTPLFDSMQLNELMALCTQLQQQVLDLEKAKSDQAIEIASLKKRVDKLEKRRQLRTIGLTRFKKLGTTRRVKSSNANLGAQEDTSKKGRSNEDIDVDVEVTLVNEQQNEDLIFDTGVLDDDEVFVDVASSEKNEQSIKLDDSITSEVVTTTSVEDSAAPTIQ